MAPEPFRPLDLVGGHYATGRSRSPAVSGLRLRETRLRSRVSLSQPSCRLFTTRAEGRDARWPCGRHVVVIGYFARRPHTLTLGAAVIDSALVVAKLGLGLSTGSLALLSDAVHSGLDTTASILAFIAVRTAARPADREHPYGHGKAENMAAYTEGLLLVIAGLVIGYEAVQRLMGSGSRVDVTPFVLGFLTFTVVLEVGRSTLLRRGAARTRSASIEALATDKLADLM